MRYPSLFFAVGALAGLLTLPSRSFAQQKDPSHPPPSEAVFARLGYNSTWPVRSGAEGFPRVCVVVRQDGGYILERKTTRGITELLKGTLPTENMERLSEMLNASDFRQLNSDRGGGVIRERLSDICGRGLAQQRRASVPQMGGPRWPNAVPHSDCKYHHLVRAASIRRAQSRYRLVVKVSARRHRRGGFDHYLALAVPDQGRT